MHEQTSSLKSLWPFQDGKPRLFLIKKMKILLGACHFFFFLSVFVFFFSVFLILFFTQGVLFLKQEHVSYPPNSSGLFLCAVLYAPRATGHSSLGSLYVLARTIGLIARTRLPLLELPVADVGEILRRARAYRTACSVLRSYLPGTSTWHDMYSSFDQPSMFRWPIYFCFDTSYKYIHVIRTWCMPAILFGRRGLSEMRHSAGTASAGAGAGADFAVSVTRASSTCGTTLYYYCCCCPRLPKCASGASAAVGVDVVVFVFVV